MKWQLNSLKKVSPQEEKVATLQKQKTQKKFCMFGHTRWSFSFNLIPYLRKMSVK